VTAAAGGREIDVVGTLALDRQRAAEVSSHAAGRVTRLNAAVGQVVRRGQVLGSVESPAIGQAAAEYLTQEASLRTARQHLARQRGLLAQHLTTQREFELAEAEAGRAAAAMDAAGARLRALGVPLGRVSASTVHAPLVAPLDGEVLRRSVLLGGWVQPETAAFTIADLSSLWVDLDVFETDLGAITAGDQVTLEVRSLGLAGVPGIVDLIHAEVDPATRMGRIRVNVPNPDRRLRPGLSVTAHIHPRTTGAVLRVPIESVRARDGRPHVLVRRGGTTAWVAVETGLRHAGEVEVTRGLAAGDVIAVAGLGLVAGSL
jgi:cobalt-zinc-cadmium efflux system membrane fusion protein